MNRGQLQQVRKQIDAIDEQLAGLLNKRAQLALQAGAAKAGQNITRPGREAEVLAHVTKISDGPLSTQDMYQIFTAVITACRTIQYKTKQQAAGGSL